MQPLVSICIPTYNRAEYLKKTIESIICQNEFINGKVEIVVSDNASTDNTSDICKEYSSYRNFFYYKNSENIADKNFPTVLSKAHGKLRKLNNDTLCLLDGSLEAMCELVDKYYTARPFIFLMNSKKNSIISYNFHDFILNVGHLITWIGSFTIWDNECEGLELDTSGCELRLWQVKKALELSYKKGSIVVCSFNFGVSIVPNKKDISYGLYNIFYCNYMELLKPYFDNGSLSFQDKYFLEKELLFKFFLYWIISSQINRKGMIYSNSENLIKAVYNQYRDKPYWVNFYLKYKQKFLFIKMKVLIKKILGRK